MLADPPRTLPAGLKHLSVSSMGLLFSCPEKWRRRYIESEYEPISGAAVVGSAVGRAEGASFQHAIGAGAILSKADTLDVFADEWEAKIEGDGERGGIDWHDEKPGRLKDQGAKVLGVYHERVAPTIRPRAVEQKIRVGVPHVDWGFTGYRDLLTVDFDVIDWKVRSPQRGVVSAEEARDDLQATAYLWHRRLEPEGERGDFYFHSMVREPKGQPGSRNVLVTPAYRAPAELDTFLGLLYRAAAEIAWRTENDVWHGPPSGAWWCSQRWCGYWDRCAFGGAHRPAVRLTGPRPAREPSGGDVLTAAEATARADGTTTAARVARQLGISTGSAAQRLRTHRRIRCEDPKRKGKKPAPRIKVYRVLADPDQPARELEASLAR